MKKIHYPRFLKLFGIILFIYVLSRINISDLAAIFKELNLFYYLIAVLFLVIGFLFRVVKWKTLTDSIEAKTSFWNLTKISAKGIFLGLVTPGKLGEFWRVKYLSNDTGITGGKAFYSAFIDRIADLTVMTVVSLVGAAVISLKFSKSQNWPLIVFILFFFAVLAYFLFRKGDMKILFGSLVKFLIPSFLKERVNSFLNEFYQGFKGPKLSLFSKVLFFSFLYYFFGGAILSYFTTLAFGISIPFWYIFLITAITWLVAVIPVTILGLGTREVSFIYFFSLLGIPASVAVAFSLFILFYDIVIIGIPGAILFLKQK